MSLTFDEMRTAIAENDWNALEALEHCLGVPPQGDNYTQANEKGGLQDKQTIASIPDQAEWIIGQLKEAYGVTFKPEVAMPAMNVSAWGTFPVHAHPASFVKAIIPQPVRPYLHLIQTPESFDYWDDLYQRTHGRAPDAEGKAFWVRWLEMEFVKGMEGYEQVASARLTKSTKP